MPKLEELLKYVSEHNDFYKKIIREHHISDPTDITQYPILNRKDLQEGGLSLLSDGASEQYYMQRLIHFKSTGTVGVPVDIYWDFQEYNQSMLALWRMRKKYHNITPVSRKINFVYIHQDAVSEKEEMYYEKGNELNICKASFFEEKNRNKICDLIDEFSPDWIYIQPSFLGKLIWYYESQNRKPAQTIRYIECVGEILSNSLRQSAYDMFGFFPTNMYGSTETNCIGYERENEMKVLDTVYVEVLTADGIRSTGEGSAIVTNLCNYAMPLIRYNLADRIIKEQRTKENSVIHVIQGRVREIITINGRSITVSFFIDLCEKVNNIVSNIILEYYFIYHTRSRLLTCCLRLKNDYTAWKERVIKIFSEYWQQYHFDIDFQIEFFTVGNFSGVDKYKLILIEND